jgi:hypothetical protein
VTAVAASGRVSPGYRHIEKRITPGDPVDLGGGRLKWYSIAPEEAPVPAGIERLARAGLHDAGAPAFPGELGFVILHRCGEAFYFLLVCTWRNENELWETVWAKDGEGDRAFRPWPAAGPHRPTYCVWELGAVCHEQRAWSRYLRSPRDPTAALAYLADTCEGGV